MRHIVKLQPEHMAFCENYCREMMRRRSAASRAVSWRKGEKDNLAVQLNGRCCEWAVATYFGLRPRHVLNWNFMGDETDLTVGDKNIDVKGSQNSKAILLIYSLEITKFYQQKRFDTLLFCRACPLPEVELVAWTTKAIFLRDHYTAPDGPHGQKLDPGTWYMHVQDLYPIEQLAAKQ